MRVTSRLRKWSLAAPLLALSPLALAQTTVTNNMVNIVTVADACDIAAIGVDFGVTAAPIPATGVIATVATSANSPANPVAGNASTGHPDAGTDGTGAVGEDDDLTLNIPIAAISGLVSDLLSTVVTGVPGVFVACTVTPSSITVTSAAPGAPTTNLPIALGGLTADFTGSMLGVGGGADASNAIDYELTFAGVDTAIASAITDLIGGFYVGAYPVTIGTIPADQTGNDIVSGFYTDIAVAAVEF